MVIKKISDGALVTGGAGFIGSHLVEKLLSNRINNIKVIDNLSSGNFQNLSRYVDRAQVKFHNGDLTNPDDINKSICEVDTIFHLAAFPEVRYFDDPKKYFEQNIESTFNLLEAIRKSSVKFVIFSSSSTVYGKPTQIPTPEDYGPLIPISLYGSSKLACEALISSYSNTYGISSYIYRFANVVGLRSNHGVIWDFVKKLKTNNRELSILGDGRQEKSYIYVQDCVDAMIHIFNSAHDKVNIVNIGTTDSLNVVSIANLVCEEMGLSNTEYEFVNSTKDGSGWIGDVKNMNLDISKMIALGYVPRYSSRDAVKNAITDLIS